MKTPEPFIGETNRVSVWPCWSDDGPYFKVFLHSEHRNGAGCGVSLWVGLEDHEAYFNEVQSALDYVREHYPQAKEALRKMRDTDEWSTLIKPETDNAIL